MVLGVEDSAMEFILLVNLIYRTVTYDWYKYIKWLLEGKPSPYYEWSLGKPGESSEPYSPHSGTEFLVLQEK